MPREVTFIECNDMDFSYKPKARLHNGQVRRINSLAASISKQTSPKRTVSTLARIQLCQHSSIKDRCLLCASELKAKALLSDASPETQQSVSTSSPTPSTDLFMIDDDAQTTAEHGSPTPEESVSFYPLELTREDHDLVQHWFTAVEDLYFTPKVSGGTSALNPVDILFQIALQSKTAFECMVLLPAAMHRKRKMSSRSIVTSSDVYRHYAKAIAFFNESVEDACAKGSLPIGDQVGCAALVLALARDGTSDSLRAYNAVSTARSSTAKRLEQMKNSVSGPLEGWLRVLAASSTWDHEQKIEFLNAQGCLPSRFEGIFRFLRQAQALSSLMQSGPFSMSTLFEPDHHERPPISRHSPLYAILTSLTDISLMEQSLPPTFMDFLYSAQTELLVIIHIHLLIRQHSPEATQHLLDNLNAKATESVILSTPWTPLEKSEQSALEVFNPLRAMLWLIYSDPTLHTPEVRAKVDEWSVPLRYWRDRPRPWPVDHLIAWLVPTNSEDSLTYLPALDVSELEKEVRSNTDLGGGTGEAFNLAGP